MYVKGTQVTHGVLSVIMDNTAMFMYFLTLFICSQHMWKCSPTEALRVESVQWPKGALSSGCGQGFKSCVQQLAKLIYKAKSSLSIVSFHK